MAGKTKMRTAEERHDPKRRRALKLLGLTAAAAFAAPTLLCLSDARASPGSGGSGGGRGGSGGGSGGRRGSGRSGGRRGGSGAGGSGRGSGGGHRGSGASRSSRLFLFPLNR
jgi:hypothetical protein